MAAKLIAGGDGYCGAEWHQQAHAAAEASEEETATRHGVHPRRQLTCDTICISALWVSCCVLPPPMVWPPSSSSWRSLSLWPPIPVGWIEFQEAEGLSSVPEYARPSGFCLGMKGEATTPRAAPWVAARQGGGGGCVKRT